jgi:hypothetical protein
MLVFVEDNFCDVLMQFYHALCTTSSCDAHCYMCILPLPVAGMKTHIYPPLLVFDVQVA